MTTNTLTALEQRIRRDLTMIDYPLTDWVIPRQAQDSRNESVLDVLIVGAGQGGLSIAFKLLRERVNNIKVIDRADAGLEGPWLNYARMHTLRSPKEVTGPDLDIPSLTFQAWFEAQYGEPAWQALNKIPKALWVDYLQWYRRLLNLPVENRVALRAVKPDGELLSVTLDYLDAGAKSLGASTASDVGIKKLLARKLVLATGIESSGGWWTPPAVAALPKRFWAHTSEAIDFSALRGRRVAVLGAGASAFDNAATALEAGTAEVRLYCRRPELQRVQPFKWLSFPGFLRHFHTLDDRWRWRIMNYLLTLREAFPRETWERARRHPNFYLHTDSPWQRVQLENDTVTLHTPNATYQADYLIIGTGLAVDMNRQPGLAGVANRIALWADRYTPPPNETNPRLACYPYLGPHFELTEKTPGNAPWLRHIYLFTYATTLSHGPSGASINAMKFAVPRLADGIVKSLFLDDIEQHYDNLRAYQLPEFLLPNESEEQVSVAPVKAVLENLATRR